MRPSYGYRYEVCGAGPDGAVYTADNFAYSLARDVVTALQDQGYDTWMRCETPLSTRILDRYEREKRRCVAAHELIDHVCAFALSEPILCGAILPDVAVLADRYHRLLEQAYERESP